MRRAIIAASGGGRCMVKFTTANPPDGAIGLDVNNPAESLSATVGGAELHGATFWAKSAKSFEVDSEWVPSRVFQFWPTAYTTGTVAIGLVSANHSIFVQHVRSGGATIVEVDEVGVASGSSDTVHSNWGITYVVGADGTASVRVSGVEFWEASELFAGEEFWMEFYWIAPNSNSNTQWWWTSRAATGRLGLIQPGDADWCGREIPSVQFVEEARELSFTGSASIKIISTVSLLAPPVSIVEEARELSFTGDASMKVIKATRLLEPAVQIEEQARELSFTGSATMKIIQVEVP